jgi:hypothetical protein
MWLVLQIVAVVAVVLAWPLGVTLSLGGSVWLLVRRERCPSCRHRAIHCWYSARRDPRPVPSFYRCERCGARLQRVLTGRWEDASALEYDAYYQDAPPLPLPPVASYRH